MRFKNNPHRLAKTPEETLKFFYILGATKNIIDRAFVFLRHYLKGICRAMTLVPLSCPDHGLLQLTLT